MKKVYSKPSVSVVNVRLFSSVLDDSPNIGQGNYSVVVEDGWAKENNGEFEEEEGLINPTQPNIWGDEEE